MHKFEEILLSFLCCLLQSSYCLKILGLFPHPSISHVKVFQPIMTELASRGHEVTVLSHYRISSLSSLPKTYREIVLDVPHADLKNAIQMDTFQGYRYEKYKTIRNLPQHGQLACEQALSTDVVQNLYKCRDEKFDVIITEFFNSDCFAAFAYKFRAPLIGLSSCVMMPWTSERFGNPTNPAYIPYHMMDQSDRIGFLPRVESTVLGVISQLMYNHYSLPQNEQVVRKYLDDGVPPLIDIVQNASLLLINTHFTLNLPRPLVPAIVEIGGVHVEEPKQLPKDIEKWIKESTHGVIYFSLGSMIKGHTFPEDKRRAFLKAFSRLPQRIIWKWENDTMPDKPDNVMVQKWMPQLDILAHSNVRAFISHGGLLGTIEAVHFGVPVVVMPQYGDQFTNAKAIEASGGGVILYLRTATEEQIYNALTKVLSPSFRQKAHELSVRFRDRPLPPLETAIYWVEYVARHRGAPHMRTAAVDMPFYQYLLLDVIAFLLAILIALIALIYYTIKFCCCRRSKKTKSD